MSFTVQHKRSGDVSRRPDPESLEEGQVAVNYNRDTPGMFFKDSVGGLVKVGPCAIGSFPPAPENYTALSKGEMWLDISQAPVHVLKVWDGTQWLTVN
jgi:hypothetical protein